MGCILSFLRSLRSYHGIHLTPKQLQRQKRQRSHKPSHCPPRRTTPPSSPEEEGDRRWLSFDSPSYGSVQGSAVASPPAIPELGSPLPTSKKKPPKFSFLMKGRKKTGH